MALDIPGVDFKKTNELMNRMLYILGQDWASKRSAQRSRETIAQQMEGYKSLQRNKHRDNLEYLQNQYDRMTESANREFGMEISQFNPVKFAMTRYQNAVMKGESPEKLDSMLQNIQNTAEDIVRQHQRAFEGKALPGDEAKQAFMGMGGKAFQKSVTEAGRNKRSRLDRKFNWAELEEKKEKRKLEEQGKLLDRCKSQKSVVDKLITYLQSFVKAGPDKYDPGQGPTTAGMEKAMKTTSKLTKIAYNQITVQDMQQLIDDLRTVSLSLASGQPLTQRAANLIANASGLSQQSEKYEGMRLKRKYRDAIDFYTKSLKAASKEAGVEITSEDIKRIISADFGILGQ